MQSGPDLDTVYQAIYALYRGTDISNKEKASVWLGEFQNSIFAWQISDKLLREKRDVESSYFAAQTMRSKIHYSFHELPENSHESLRDSLLQHLRQCDESMSRAIVTQLVLALADLYLQVSSWTVPVGDLVNQFNTSSYHIYILLEILTMLAEEANSRRLRIGANRRKQLRDDFLSQADIVLQFLSHCIEKFRENVTLVSHIFKCLGAWLSLSSVPTSFLASSVLMERLFQILANLDCDKHLHDSATDCVVQALYLTENPGDHPELATTLFVKIHELQATYQLTVARDDEDKLQNFCRIFTEMAESLLPFIVENASAPLGSLRTLDLLLDCVGHYDYSVSNAIKEMKIIDSNICISADEFS
uniref:Importin N-terminal domain-containing protein n=1 Tax=Romanomermis culicivorax TaxID=13658 RepID=A0A915JAC2_ROMCU